MLENQRTGRILNSENTKYRKCKRQQVRKMKKKKKWKKKKKKKNMKMQYIEYTKCKKVKFWNENKKNTLLRKYKIPKYTLLLVFFLSDQMIVY